MKIVETINYQFTSTGGVGRLAVTATAWRTDDHRLIVATLEEGRLVALEVRDMNTPFSAGEAEPARARKAK